MFVILPDDLHINQSINQLHVSLVLLSYFLSCTWYNKYFVF